MRNKIRMICGIMIALLIGSAGSAFAAGPETPLTLSCETNTLRVTNGKSVSLTVKVENTGASQVSGIRPKVELPYKWVVESMKPENLDLRPGESGSFVLTLAAPPSQNAGTHEIKLVCQNEDLESNSLVIPAAVSTDIRYLWVITAGVVVVAMVALVYFKKHGRR
ncbi:COG1470 family protein [Lacrimispora sphenoides]|jgi:uncharacterized membrane protein|uniref:COG1470 family protein n=1 Tax=Lacrimispora sphenoides TaxID=29370 RepID=UPI000B81AC8D|nr:NEW3 domain-containing protein [Lacrimispora sphenoides]